MKKTYLGLRIPQEVRDELDALRGNVTLSELVIGLLQKAIKLEKQEVHEFHSFLARIEKQEKIFEVYFPKIMGLILLTRIELDELARVILKDKYNQFWEIVQDKFKKNKEAIKNENE